MVRRITRSVRDDLAGESVEPKLRFALRELGGGENLGGVSSWPRRLRLRATFVP